MLEGMNRKWKGSIRIAINSTGVSCKAYTLVNKGNPSAFPSIIKAQPIHNLKKNVIFFWKM